MNLLLAVSHLSIFAHSHGFFLDIVLGEQTGLTSHHLRYGSWNHHVFNGVISPPWLPALWGNHLVKGADC